MEREGGWEGKHLFTCKELESHQVATTTNTDMKIAASKHWEMAIHTPTHPTLMQPRIHPPTHTQGAVSHSAGTPQAQRQLLRCLSREHH